jgi:CRP/FNR family transcriptional regulator, cyclic AMP receptor protein
VAESQLIALDLKSLRSLAESDVEVMRAIATQLAVALVSALKLVVLRSLGWLRERLAYDILERACRRQLDVGRLEAHATHSDLANAIGSSREVVSRSLRALRDDGIIEGKPGAISVIDPARLMAIVRSFVI